MVLLTDDGFTSVSDADLGDVPDGTLWLEVAP